VEAMGEHVDVGLVIGNQLAIHPDFLGTQTVYRQG
jgi:hypothetical protein